MVLILSSADIDSSLKNGIYKELYFRGPIIASDQVHNTWIPRYIPDYIYRPLGYLYLGSTKIYLIMEVILPTKLKYIAPVEYKPPLL
jgi:hypothetical protein